MIEIIEKPKDHPPVYTAMANMKPLQVGVVVNSDMYFNGHYVMRTAARSHFEVINLTKGFCWTASSQDVAKARYTAIVRLLDPDEKVVIELSNKCLEDHETIKNDH